MSSPLFDALIKPHQGNPAPFLTLDDGTVLSFDAFTRSAARAANVLAATGVAPGDRLVVQAPKTAEMLMLYAGAVMAGAVFLPLNTAYTTAEVDYFLGDATPGLLVCTTAAKPALAPLAAGIGAQVLTLDADGSGSLRDQMDQASDSFAPRPRQGGDLAALLYTSGTTGRSKGAMMTHSNLLSNARALTDLWQITDADRLIHALPIFHTHGLFVAMNTSLLAGAQVRLMARFDADQIFEALPQGTLMMGVPTFYTRLLDDPRLTRAGVANMRVFISGSAPLLAETHTAFEAATGQRILERYGMTETNMITSNPYSGARIAGTVGQPLPGVEVKLTDPDTGEPVAQGAVGMIEVRGANVFKGYWNMPEKTAQELREDGFFITGDLGQIDADGYLQIVGRSKDLIISGGYNIYPKEIEDVLNQLPGVVESAVFGIPHADFGEAVIATLVMTPGTTLDTDAAQSTIKDQLARFKHPRQLIEVDALPRNAMGKVQKNALRTQYQDR